uniref:Putative secreted protein n=1 Tax=Ixodes ricinus TaxID=34613 RepID=A0A6B0TTU5_IXORI
MGKMPCTIISALLLTKLGNTRPGQSHSHRPSSSCKVWKCFVLPGVVDTDTFLWLSRALMVELLPTLGYPTSPTTV